MRFIMLCTFEESWASIGLHAVKPARTTAATIVLRIQSIRIRCDLFIRCERLAVGRGSLIRTCRARGYEELSDGRVDWSDAVQCRTSDHKSRALGHTSRPARKGKLAMTEGLIAYARQRLALTTPAPAHQGNGMSPPPGWGCPSRRMRHQGTRHVAFWPLARLGQPRSRDGA